MYNVAIGFWRNEFMFPCFGLSDIEPLTYSPGEKQVLPVSNVIDTVDSKL